jgi:hypothetical protein
MLIVEGRRRRVSEGIAHSVEFPAVSAALNDRIWTPRLVQAARSMAGVVATLRSYEDWSAQ